MSSAQTSDRAGEPPWAAEAPEAPPQPQPAEPGAQPGPGGPPSSAPTAPDESADSEQAGEPGPDAAAPAPEPAAQAEPEPTASPQTPPAAAEAAGGAATAEDSASAAAGIVADEPGWSSADEIGFGTASDQVGFADTDAALADGEEPQDEGTLTLDSFFRTQEALWTERFADNPFAKARQSLDADLRYKRPFELDNEDLRLDLTAGLHVEYDVAYRHDRDSYDDPTLDEYEAVLLSRQMYAGLSYDVVDITFGRQIVAWGEGIVLSPIDVVNPRDLREPGLAELDDMRIAVLATRVGLFLDDHRLESMIVHESYFGLRPPPLAPFSPIRQLILDDPQYGSFFDDPDMALTLKYDDVPGRFMKKGIQFMNRWTYSGHGFDVALYVASVLDKMGVAELPAVDELSEAGLPVRLWHPRYTMLANSGAVPVEDFLIKWELGVDLDRPANVTDTEMEEFNLDVEYYTQINGMVGFNYTGFDDTTLIFEYAQSYVVDNPERSDEADNSLELLNPVEQPVIMIRGERSFLHERLNLIGMGILFGIWDYTGWLARLELWYELVDALKVGLGYVTYQPTDDVGPILGFETHDRLYANLRWDFLLQ